MFVLAVLAAKNERSRLGTRVTRFRSGRLQLAKVLARVEQISGVGAILKVGR